MRIEEIETDTHEKVLLCEDPNTGLEAIIALHNTRLGSCIGGCRMYPYKNRDEALYDVLRLSEGMTYKSAISGLNLGGGKAVIVGDPSKKSPELLKSFARFVDSFEGLYIAAEDVGTTIYDMAHIQEETDFVCGIGGKENTLGDPSIYTAYGVLQAIRAAVSVKMGKSDLKGISVAVMGIGHVGENLCHMLIKEGATILISDISSSKTEAFLKNAQREYGEDVALKIVDNDAIISEEVDVFSPCALGGILDEESIGRLRASIVVGAANNQLKTPEIGELLFQKGVLYAPDYVANAGGLMAVHEEYFCKNIDATSIFQKVKDIYDVLLEIFIKSETDNLSPSRVANKLAEKRFQN